LIVSFGFKVAAVPFHFWTPDVYEGAPVPVAGWMAAGVKAAAFAGMGRVFYVIFSNEDFSELPISWNAVWLILSILTMTIGNLIALVQMNIKRILAYSSIAHAGYILLGFYAAKNGTLNPAVPFYLVTYIAATIGAFSVLSMLGGGGEEDINLFTAAGLSKRRPFLALILLICLFSLAGIPPTAGFLGKFYLFKEVLLVDVDKNLIFVIIAVLNSVVAAYYYLRIIVYMYMHEPSREIKTISSIPAIIVMLVIAALILQIGLFPTSIIEFAEKATVF
ncbi:MAG: NADH-quinone oxidoreductase subunit N, partial [Deltaproteobacteria bacterium]|nr:NADH-quinone oxidoreductase subunit N [Deltaproteobacteria bacterium]